MTVNFDERSASKLALEALRQYPLDAVLFVAEISLNDFMDGRFDWDDAEYCKDFSDVAELLNGYRNSFRIGAVDGLQIVAVDYDVAESGENVVCLFGVRDEYVDLTK